MRIKDKSEPKYKYTSFASISEAAGNSTETYYLLRRLTVITLEEEEVGEVNFCEGEQFGLFIDIT